MGKKTCLTIVTVVIYQDDFLEEVGWGAVDHAVHRPQDDRESLVHEDEHNRNLREVLLIGQLFASEGENEERKRKAGIKNNGGAIEWFSELVLPISQSDPSSCWSGSKSNPTHYIKYDVMSV